MKDWNIKQLEQEIEFLMDTRREIFRNGFVIEERISLLKKRFVKLKEKNDTFK